MHWTVAGLWLTVVASGIYHGVNPGMGWPLAVSAGLMGRSRKDLGIALVPLAAGHILAMLRELKMPAEYWRHLQTRVDRLEQQWAEMKTAAAAKCAPS